MGIAIERDAALVAQVMMSLKQSRDRHDTHTHLQLCFEQAQFFGRVLSSKRLYI